MSEWDKGLIEMLESSSVSETKRYDSEMIRRDVELRPIYDFLGDMISGHLKPKSVVHWGCQSGLLIERFFRHGMGDLFGIEENVEFREYWEDEIVEQLRSKLEISELHKTQVDAKFEMAICLVGETISEENVSQFIENVTKSSNKWVWFCGRAVGDYGKNCQPISYWEDCFAEGSNFRPEWKTTFQIKQEMLQNHGLALGASWLRDNFILFKNEIEVVG